MEDPERKELEKIVSDSVEKTLKKHRRRSLKPILFLIIAAAVILGAVYIHRRWSDNTSTVKQVEDQDLTLQNRGLIGYKAADFAGPILGQAKSMNLLIVEEKDASVNTTITDAGLFDLGIFTKSQVITIHGKGEYTVDLTGLTQEDISLDDNYVVTVRIPHAQLHTVTFDPDETEIGDTDRGWLAFGSVKMTQEQQKKIETAAVKKLTKSLGTAANLTEADRFARLTVTEDLQTIVNSVSPIYRVQVEFQEATGGSSTGASAQTAAE